MENSLKAVFVIAATLAVAQAGSLSGRRIPSFSLPDSQAVYHDILDYRGKVLLVEVMQTNCPHCQELSAQLEKVNEKYGEKLPILAIVVPPDSVQTVAPFITRFHIRYPVLFDCGQATAAMLKVTPTNPQVHFPHLLLVDKRGMIVDDFDSEHDDAVLTGPGLMERIDKFVADAAAMGAAKKAK